MIKKFIESVNIVEQLNAKGERVLMLTLLLFRMKMIYTMIGSMAAGSERGRMFQDKLRTRTININEST